MGLTLCKDDKGENVVESVVLADEMSRSEECFAIEPSSLDQVEPYSEEDGRGAPCESVVAETTTTSSREKQQDKVQEEEPLPDYSVHDHFGVPWYKSAAAMNRKGFIRSYFTQMVPARDGTGYVMQERDSGQLHYALSLADTDGASHPPPTFSRRLTMNYWWMALMDSMLISGLRLAVLQANLQVLMAMLDDETYRAVPKWVFIVMAVALVVAVVVWAILGAVRAYKYRQFIHPDRRFKRFSCYACSTLLCMFAIPNDIILIPIHVLPVERGGLCSSVDLVEGCYRWPAFTIAHTSKPDHDYTNAAGLTVQLPLFLLVDVFCTAAHVTIAAHYGFVQYSAFIQMGLCTAYAVIKLYVALRRMLVRRQLLDIWLRTATDPRMSARMQFMAMNKFLAEGGSKRRIEQGLRKSNVRPLSNRTTSKELTKRSTTVGVLLGVPDAELEEVVKECPSVGDVTDHNVQDFMRVPWYRSSRGMTQIVSSTNRKVTFVDNYYVHREVQSDGLYGPKKNGDLFEYKFEVTSQEQEHYPPPCFYRRLSLNTWQEMLTSVLSEAALRSAGLQASFMMAVMMLENPLYQTMKRSLWVAFILLYCMAILLWCLAGFKVMNFIQRYVHPDSKWAQRRALLSGVVLAMLSCQVDVGLVLVQLPPTNKGGICYDATCIEGNRAWPVHSLAHQGKLDHDFVNTNNLFLQLPLFLLVDIGCTCVNLAIALDLGVFNYTTLLQMCTSGTYAFIKVFKIARQIKIKKKLLPIWLKMTVDPHMPEHKRLQAIDKYVFARGSKRALVKARKEAGLPSPTPKGQVSASIDSL